MKLNKENIQFIDNYLENSNIVFADIRMEIVDHVASDIEEQIKVGDTRDFYYVFKDYMIENKAQLLKENTNFLKSADKKIWKALLKEFTKPITYLIFIVSFIGFYVLQKTFNFESFYLYFSLIPILGLIGFLFTYMIYHKLKKLERFSVVERLAFPFLALYQLTTLVFNISKHAEKPTTTIWFIGGLSLVLTLMLMMFKISFILFKSYEKRFKHIT